MIKTIYDYGVHLRDAPETVHHFSIFAPPYTQRNMENQSIYFANIQDKAFIDLETESYTPESAYLEKYIFRELASANSAPVVPSLHFFYVDKADKWAESVQKFITKLTRCFEGHKALFNKYVDTEKLLEALPASLKALPLTESRNYFFTLKIDGAYLGEIPEIRALLETGAYDKYFKSKNDLYKATDKFCAVTYQNVPEVWGRVDTLGFTINDIAFSRNGFNAKDSYKMFPVSPDAVKVLEGTMNILERELSFSFYNLRFFVLPHFVTVTDMEKRKELAIRFYEETKMSVLEARENARTFENLNQSIVNSETLFVQLAETDVYYDIFFYEQKQAQFSIKLHVCDILPSRFNKILKVKNYIESKYHVITVKETKEGKKYHYNIRFAGIKDYFSTKVRTDLVYEPLFFKIIEAVFYKNPLDEKRILSAFMQKITTAFKQQNSFEFTDHVKHSFCIHQFFQTLQLFDKMEQNIDNQAVVCLNAKDFVAQHPLFFPEKAPLKKAAFYLGCATEVLLTAQRKRLGSEPFAKELNNLQFGYRELQVLYPKLLAKAKQYEEAGDIYTIYSDKNGVLIKSDLHDLTHAASECLTHDDAANGDKVEASFAFSLGLVMEKEFTRERVRVRMEEKERKEAAKKAV